MNHVTKKLFVLSLSAALLVGLTVPALAQEHKRPQTHRGAEAGEPVVPFVFEGDVRLLPRAQAWQPGDGIKEIPRRYHGEIREPLMAPEGQVDPLLELQEGARRDLLQRAFTAPSVNVAGQGFTGVNPPDTVGDVGTDFYIQAINGSGGGLFRIHNKSNGSVAAGATAMDSLGSGDCANGAGDPIVLYDELAGRWMLAEFSTQGANKICVYISQTGNPVTGGWFNYSFQAPSFPDYLKFGVWPDAYYVGTNENSPAVYALDRNQMLAGNPATFQRFTAPSLSGFGFQMVIPSDVDGSTAPPAGSPNYFLRHRDGAAHGGSDALQMFNFSVDWGTPANSTFTGPVDIPISAFDSNLCGLSSFSCITQPSGSNPLDPLREVVMFRLGYRNFGSHEALVGNLVTDVSGSDDAGVRWFELRKVGAGSWSLFQEGTYAPDSTSRWMGAIAMDGDGNIALGYNVSSSSVFPGLRYTGRLAADATGTMTQGETTLIAGSGSNNSIRYGDYAAMGVDPVDGCTFWFTGEYNPSGSWSTRIGAFSFDSCGGPACTPQAVADAGPDQTICSGESVQIGTAAQAGTTYSWSPGGATSAQITVSPASTTVYTVTATTACGSAQDSVTVTVDSGGGGGLDDDLEGSTSGWSTTGLWHLTDNSACASPGYSSATHAFYYGQDSTCTYNSGAANTGSLTSPQISGITASSTLTFDYFRQVESFSGDFDRTVVEIVTGSGSTTVWSRNSSDTSENAWVSSGAIGLSGFAGQTVQVRFTFDTGDNVGNDFTGWFIDDVVVTAESACDGCTSDAQCTDGQFCNGAETCNLGTGICESGSAPNCSDGVSCTVDSCNEGTDSCDNTPDNGACDNGLFCDGSETCNATLGCQAGSAPSCNDGVSCTVDSCNEGSDSCDNTPNDGACDNGLFCDGAETCNATLGCQDNPDPCTGGQTCNETTDVCEGGGSGCPAGSIDFNSLALTSYSNQNSSNGTAVLHGGDTLQLTGNTWVRSTQLFNVTANTRLEFDFTGTTQGEIHAIGFEENDTLNDAPRHFQFWGTQNWTGTGKIDWNPKYSGSGAAESFSIPVGQSYTGSMWLVFTNDDDAAAAADSSFSCVRIVEDTPGACTVDDDFESGTAGWVNDAASTCTTGDYVAGDPANAGGGQQIVGSHSGVTSLFTATNASAGNADVDGGNCILGSPSWAVANTSTLSVWYWHGQRDNADDPNGGLPSGDGFALEYSTNGGGSWNTLASNGDTASTATWTNATAAIPAGSSVQLRMQCSDGSAAGDLVECGIDDVSICE